MYCKTLLRARVEHVISLCMHSDAFTPIQYIIDKHCKQQHNSCRRGASLYHSRTADSKMWSGFAVSVVCILLLFQLALGDKEFRFLQDSRVRPKTTDVGSVREVNRQSTCTASDYFRKLDVLECDAKYIKALLKESKDSACFAIEALELPNCGTNHNGTVCATLHDYSYYVIDEVWRSCFNFSDGIYRIPSAGKCKSECILALRKLSDQVGCCFYTSDYIEFVQTPSLWMNCGVERPEQCTDTPIVENQPITIFSLLGQCSYKYFLDQYRYTYCKYLGEELSKINMECEYSEQETLLTCGYDKGQYCTYLNYPHQTLLSTYDKCHYFFEEGTTDKWTCNDECEAAIQDLKDTYGCCVITFNNTYKDKNTITASQVLRSDLWTSCGIEIPSNCIASSLDQLRPPDDSLQCGVSGSTTVMAERQVQPKAGDVGGTHKIIRRDSKNTCSRYSDERHRKINVLECDPNYIEALRKENQDSACLLITALGLADCGNHSGTVCAVLDEDSTDNAIEHVLASCFNLSDGIYRLPSAGKCKSQCILALRRLSDQVGCCIHTSDYIAIVQTPSLWMNCGVERPELCADTPIFENQPRDFYSLLGQCSYEYLFTQYQYTYCKYLGEELSKINTECGYSEQETLETCGYDKGQYCTFFKYPRQTLLSVYNKCHSFFEEGTTDKWTCNDECEAAIQDLKDTYGCCVKSFNNTYDTDAITASQVLRSDLWTSCGIEIPSNCIASSLDQLRPPDDSLKCEARGSTTVPVMTYSTLLIMIGLIIATS